MALIGVLEASEWLSDGSGSCIDDADLSVFRGLYKPPNCCHCWEKITGLVCAQLSSGLKGMLARALADTTCKSQGSCCSDFYPQLYPYTL
eukprot:COSAG02_NODE_24328_length_691_cov_2.927365_1_plen_89_part_01